MTARSLSDQRPSHRRPSYRRSAVAALAGFATLTLAACTTIPSNGPVNEGDGVVASSEPIVPVAEGPRPDDSPAGIVNGFVTASGAGFSSDFTVARQYLMPEAAANWDPTATVTVYDSGALDTGFDDPTDTVTYDIPVLANVDESGRLTEAAEGTRQTLTFTLEQDDDDQWRIAELEDGTILPRATFLSQFSQVSLIFATLDETTRVPEARWLPGNKAVTLAAKELVEGPSESLAPAVHTGFPAGSALDPNSVIVTDGIAAVQLSAPSAGTAAERSLAEEQMRLTLTSIPGVRDVNVTVGGVPLGGDDTARLDQAPLPGADAAILLDGRLGMWDGERLWQVPNSVGDLPQGSAGLAQTFGDPIAAWVVGGSTLVSSDALAEGAAGLKAAGDDGATGTTMETSALFKGTSMTAAAADRQGWFWTAERASGSAFVAARPDGTIAKLAVDWLRGTTVQAIAVSRDGVRIAVLSRVGTKQVLEVASIVRGEDGAPLTIGDPVEVGADLGPSVDLTWVDDLTLAALGESAGDAPSDLWLVKVGGLTVAEKAVSGAVDISAREGERSLVVVDSSGNLFVRSGTVWSKVATGPSEVAYSG